MTYSPPQALKDKMLFEALESGKIDKIEKELNAGANPNARDASGATPLDRAITRNNWKACVALLEAGADPNEKKLLMVPPLIYMIKQGNIDVCDALVKAGANIHEVYGNGNSVLHYACEHAGEKFCSQLLASGVDMEVRTDAGYTPLMVAAIRNRPGLCEVLLDAGADVGAIDTIRKDSRLFSHGYDATRKVLLRAGAEPTEGFKENLEDMRKSVFSPDQCPDRIWCIQNDQIRNHVIDTCVTGQFDRLIVEPLLKSGSAADLQLFVDIWDRLPDWCQQKNQGSYIEYAKRTKMITLPSVPSLEAGRAHHE